MHGVIEDKFSRDFGRKIKNKRLELGMTQDELAAKLQLLGIESSNFRIHRIEAGAYQITACEVFAISHILSLDLNFDAKRFVEKISV